MFEFLSNSLRQKSIGKNTRILVIVKLKFCTNKKITPRSPNDEPHKNICLFFTLFITT